MTEKYILNPQSPIPIKERIMKIIKVLYNIVKNNNFIIIINKKNNPH